VEEEDCSVADDIPSVGSVLAYLLVDADDTMRMLNVMLLMGVSHRSSAG
jgi:hypothetical protein